MLDEGENAYDENHKCMFFPSCAIEKRAILVSEKQTRDEHSMASNPLRLKLKIILDTFDSLSRQGGVVDRELMLSALYGKVETAEAEQLLTYLVKEGILQSPRPGILEKP